MKIFYMEKIMDKDLPRTKIATPRFTDKLVPLPYQKNILLCPQTHTRWKSTNGYLERDLRGERSWDEMGAYVGKSYHEVFMDSYRSALDAKQVC